MEQYGVIEKIEKVTQKGWGWVGNKRVFFWWELPLWTLNNDGFNIDNGARVGGEWGGVWQLSQGLGPEEARA